ncbi:hypothetical protein V2J09_002015 [Rumex salicifolius]
MNRVLVAAGVAAAHKYADQGQKWKSIKPSVKRLISGPGAAAAVAAAVAVQSDIGMKLAATDESLRQAMYMNCWGQS